MKRALNLMTERAFKRELVRNSVHVWSRIAAVVLLLLVILGIAQYRVYQQSALLQELAEVDYEPTRQLKLENQRLRNEIESLEKEEELLLTLSINEPLLSLVGLTSEVIAEQGDKLYLQHLEIDRKPLVAESNDPFTLYYALEGFTNDSEAANNLADVIRESGPFASVKLDMNSKASLNTPNHQAFTIHCTD